jgi:hypothetical protein
MRMGNAVQVIEQKVQFDTRISIQVCTNVIVVLYVQSTNGMQK